MRNNDTAATEDTLGTESFEQDRKSKPLAMKGYPRFDTIGFDTEAATSPLLSGGTTKMATTELCVSLQARGLPKRDDARAPVDIIVALDTSGSMQDRGKIDLCKKTLALLLRQLLPQDRFGLITYENHSRVALPIQRMTLEHKIAASQAIESIDASGGTNISSAVSVSAQEMQTIKDPNPVQTVFFLTDGLANDGICTTDGLASLVRNCYTNGSIPTKPPGNQARWRWAQIKRWAWLDHCATRQEPLKREYLQASKEAEAPYCPSAISLHTFGYGADHNAALLREMASASEGGSYYFIEEDKDVGSAFGDALGGVLSVVAQNAVVTLNVPVAAKAMGVEIKQVHHDKAILRENGSYTVNLGDFYAEETRDLVVTVSLATPQEPMDKPIPHATAGLSYTDTLGASLVQGESVMISVARPFGGQLSEENPHVAAQFFRVCAVKEMKEATTLACAGQYQEAKAKFVSMKMAYHHCSTAVQSTDQATELFRDADEMERSMESGYSHIGLARLSAMSHAHHTQRAAISSASAFEPKAYKRSKKRADCSSTLSIHT